MRTTLKKATLSAMMAAGGLIGLGSASAQAQGYGDHHDDGHSSTYVRRSYSSSTSYGGGGYGGGYAAPVRQYYGNGGHDYQPHWHTKQTPIGNYSYYGLGRHDFRPHGHDETPSGITSYSNGRFSSTQSYSPPAYVYRPW